MSEPSAPVQKAIYDALRADAVLTALTGGQARIHDDVPPNAAFPYIQIGESQTIDAGNTCEPDIFEHYETIHVWSRAVGRVEAKLVSERVREVLKSLIVPGFVVHSATTERLDHLKDPDGVTAHSVLAMRFLIVPA